MNSSTHTPNARPRPSPRPSPRSGNTPRHRPATIAELADRARDDLWDPSKGVKYWLKTGESHRRAGKGFFEVGDLESAFVEYAKAATIVLEKLPLHRDYATTLTADQRHNLGLNGQDILDSLSDLKPTLVERYERWLAQHPDDLTAQPSPGPYAGSANIRRSDSMRRQEDQHARTQEDERDYARHIDAARREEQMRYEEQRKEEARRIAQEEIDRRRHEDIEKRRREIARREEEQRARSANDPEARQKDGIVATARRAAGVGQHESNMYGLPQNSGSVAANSEAQRRQQDFERQQAEMKRREEDIIRHRRQNGIARRQEEADADARAARQGLTPSPSHPHHGQSPSHVPHFPGPHDASLLMPLESPTRNDDDYSTDRESVTDSQVPWHQPKIQHTTTPTRAPVRSPSYPPPVTTTSPTPGSGPVRYPTLMSQHQLKQGYAPSLQSMFMAPGSTASAMGTPSLLFVPDMSSSSSLYPSNALPRPSQPSQYPYGQSTPQHLHNASASSYPRYPGPAQASPVPPPPVPQRQQSQEDVPRIARPANAKARADPVMTELKNVSVPRDCLPKFLSIAALNTARNRETCGLLLGKDKGHKFAVTTLLIPKQHSTSDTCTMDEEELVMQFTEERALITLGWIHTHPSQSCFMSSVDLHTHSGFQRMLPESFAVVCAPKSTPNFGIFRLTDPPGLQTILGCNAKEAFHPHPDVPIYTDADKGHVQMRDLPLEIVDLRS